MLWIIFAPVYLVFLILLWSTDPWLVLIGGAIAGFVIYRIETA